MLITYCIPHLHAVVKKPHHPVLGAAKLQKQIHSAIVLSIQLKTKNILYFFLFIQNDITKHQGALNMNNETSMQLEQ